jgi:hypothetical protein
MRQPLQPQTGETMEKASEVKILKLRWLSNHEAPHAPFYIRAQAPKRAEIILVIEAAPPGARKWRLTFACLMRDFPRTPSRISA